VQRPRRDRRCPTSRSARCAVFADEASRCWRCPIIRAAARTDGGFGRKTPYVRFDLNDYSIPHTHVRRMLTVLADAHEVALSMRRSARRSSGSYDKGAQIEADVHVKPGRAKARRSSARATTASRTPSPPARLCWRAPRTGSNLGPSLPP